METTSGDNDCCLNIVISSKVADKAFNNKDNRATSIDVIQVSFLLTFSTLNNCFYLELWTGIYLLGKFTYHMMFHYSYCCCISWWYFINTTNNLNKTMQQWTFQVKSWSLPAICVEDNYTIKRKIRKESNHIILRTKSWLKLDCTRKYEFQIRFLNSLECWQHINFCPDKSRF